MQDVSYVQKESRRVNNQYTFVSHDAVSAKLHPLLVKHGIVFVPTVVHWDVDGNRTQAMVSCQFYNVDDPQDMIAIHMLGFGIDPGDKGPGKAVSYATKYAMLKLFVLETGDDPEVDADARHEPEKQDEATITEDELLHLHALVGDVGVDEDAMLEYYSVNRLDELTQSQYEHARKSLLKKAKKGDNT